ncbi:hypothetical protein ACFX13_000407 [Malus domestica]
MHFSISLTSTRIVAIFLTLSLTRNLLNVFWIFSVDSISLTSPPRHHQHGQGQGHLRGWQRRLCNHHHLQSTCQPGETTAKMEANVFSSVTGKSPLRPSSVKISGVLRSGATANKDLYKSHQTVLEVLRELDADVLALQNV